ncbi:hypothetical protein CU304_07690 [Prochlorococcus marinus str. MU1415]|nr:hypothetical protein [Prochlorococcus marinus str. MU1415]
MFNSSFYLKSNIKSRFQKNQFNKKLKNLAYLIAVKPLNKKVKTKKLRKFPVIPNTSSCCVNLSSQI